jgi:hypothetical protein
MIQYYVKAQINRYTNCFNDRLLKSLRLYCDGVINRTPSGLPIGNHAFIFEITFMKQRESVGMREKCASWFSKSTGAILVFFLLVSVTIVAWGALTITAHTPVTIAATSTSATATFNEFMAPGTITTGSFTLSQFVGVKSVAAGDFHTVALKNDGTVVAWGDNGAGQTTVPSGLSGVTAIAAGTSHTVALKKDGTVVAWGLNEYGETTVPSGVSGVTAIAAGTYHTVALKNDGTVVAWGGDGAGPTTVPGGV